MISHVEITNPGFTEAMAGIAGLGQAIDRAVQKASFAGLGFDAGNRFGTEAVLRNSSDLSSPISSFGIPPLPELKPLQDISWSISDALFHTIAQHNKNFAEISESYNHFNIVDEIRKRSDPVTDGLKESTSPDNYWRGLIEGVIGGVAGILATPYVGGLGGLAVATTVGSMVFGGFELYDRFDPEPFEMRENSRRALADLEQLSMPALDSGSDTNLHNYRDFLFRHFDQAFRSLSSYLDELNDNIESRDNSPEANALRYDSLEVRPSILDDYKKAIELYNRLFPGTSPSLASLDRAIELRPKTGNLNTTIEPEHGESHPSNRSSHLTLASYSPSRPSAGSPTLESERAEGSLQALLDAVLARLNEPLRIEPVRLEVRVLDDRVIARRLDGNRDVNVDFSRGPRLVGYVSI